jgi:DNA-binding MarR family transcriptional regulator
MGTAPTSSTIFNPHYSSINTTSKIVVAFERISEAFRVMLWQSSKSTGLSPLQIQIVTFLSFHPPVQRKVSYLAQEFNMTKPTVSDAIKTLEEKGLIVKITEENDTRSYTINLTDKGNLVAQETSLFAQKFNEALGGMPPIEQEELLEHLVSIIHSFHKKGILTIQRTCFTCTYHTQSTMNTSSNKQSYCKLLDQTLHPSDIRLDCPHHEIKGELI